METEEFENKLAEKCEEIGITVDELTPSLLAEMEDQIYEENQ